MHLQGFKYLLDQGWRGMRIIFRDAFPYHHNKCLIRFGDLVTHVVDGHAEVCGLKCGRTSLTVRNGQHQSRGKNQVQSVPSGVRPVLVNLDCIQCRPGGEFGTLSQWVDQMKREFSVHAQTVTGTRTASLYVQISCCSDQGLRVDPCFQSVLCARTGMFFTGLCGWISI